MVGPFEKAALDLKPGEVSEIVKTQFGYHIIKLEERKLKRVRPLEEVREEIIRDLQQEAAEREVRMASRRAFNRLFSSKDLEGYAQDNGLTVQKTGLFVFGEGPEDTQSENLFSRQVFALQPDELTPVFSINKKYYLVKLTDKKQSHIAPLETVREAVLSEVQRNKRFELARKQAENALTMLAENRNDWQAVAKKTRKEIKQVEITRPGDFVAGLGRNPALKQAAFKLDAGQTAERVFATDSSSVLVRARLKTVPSEEEFEAEKEQLRQQQLQAKQQETFKEYIQKLKDQYSVNLDRELFETL
jgi:peptidyl-prolyl cis-trans isomerase D